MYKALVMLLIMAGCLTGCKKSSIPSASPAKSGDAVQQRLQELAGSGATDCGRLTSQAQDQLKAASACAIQASQNKQPFYVAYDLPGMTVALAGNSEGKLYSVQSIPPQGNQPDSSASLKSEPCPSELRIAQSGRVTCLAPGSFGMNSMGASPHGGGSMPSSGGVENPHGGMTMPPPGTRNPHAGGNPPAKKQ